MKNSAIDEEEPDAGADSDEEELIKVSQIRLQTLDVPLNKNLSSDQTQKTGDGVAGKNKHALSMNVVEQDSVNMLVESSAAYSHPGSVHDTSQNKGSVAFNHNSSIRANS